MLSKREPEPHDFEKTLPVYIAEGAAPTGKTPTHTENSAM